MDNGNEVSRTVRIGLGSGHVALGVGLGLVLWLALPARYLPVDVPVALIALLLVVSGGALLGSVRQGPLLMRVSSALTLVVGLALLTGLLWSAVYLKGVYGDLGRGASAFFKLIAFTILPYLVIYPGVALFVLRPTPPAPAAAAKEPAPEQAE
ncbi:MAG: hypothetical protein HY907_22710 [Deltaproteobacteria bacterium]|nr:hypothetical protein [Deltaproteobacteria bacterium]